MKYEKEILRILAEAGSTGLSVKKISRHVFNASNSIFEVLNFEEVHLAVQQYLTRNSKDSKSLLEKVGPRGIYRLNTNTIESQQLMLQFLPDEENEEDTVKPTKDLSLSLFEDYD
ncbi:MAG: hypothetical protein J6Z18_10090 [Prevotella sp.]|nr:hypothetical protein [Prevotella sp.]